MLFKIGELGNEGPAGPADKLGKPTTHAQIAKECKTWERLSSAIGTLKRGEDLHFSTAAYWSTHDLVRYIVHQIGPSTLTACTWSFSQPGVTQLVRLFEEGLITDARLLVDWRIKLKVSDALALLRKHCSKFRISHCHAKVSVLRSETMCATIVGSANWTNNPRIEAGVISTDPEIADFHEGWINAEINNTDPFQKDCDPADIPDAPIDTSERNFIVIRGLPGSGKTTLAALFPEAVICENDQFFTKNGVYQFQPNKIGEASKHTYSKALNAMKDGAPTVILSNVGAQTAHFEKYTEAAQKYGYRTHTVIKENRAGSKSIHGLTGIQVDAMRGNFEVKL